MNLDQPHIASPKFDEWRQRADDYVRREPTRATATAFGAGLLFSRLPLGALAATLVGLAFSLLRPTLLLLGALKACELYREKTQDTNSHE